MIESRTLSILILEDQALVRAGMKALVQISEPHSQVHEASNYDEAIERFANKVYDIAFLDIDLKSTKTGIDVLRYIREKEFDTKAVMLSGQDEKSVVMTCIEAGASGYILKDMENDGIFHRALDTIFQGSIFLPPTVLGRGGFTPSSTLPSYALSAQDTGLNGRLLETLYYLCQGLPNKTIARKMGISEDTVRKDYNTRIFQHFKVARRTELIVEISRRGLTVPSPNDVHHTGKPR